MNPTKKIIVFTALFLAFFFRTPILYAEDIIETLSSIQKDLKTLERAVYSGNTISSSESLNSDNSYSEDALTRHLLKLSDIEKQFQELTNKFEEVNFKIDKLSNRLSKIQSDNQLRFQDLEKFVQSGDIKESLLSASNSKKKEEELPGTSQPQDLGVISPYDTQSTGTTQETQSIEATGTVVTEIFESEEKILPEGTPEEQYEFATSFLRVGDYNTAEIALKEFIISNNEHNLAGSAQYWYAETFRIRQLYMDAASAYLEGYQKYPKSAKAPINLLKLGVSLVHIGEKDQGCSMITGVVKQYPKASQSVLQKAKYEEKKFDCPVSKT